ncbi:HNH endonuclease [Amycolatopsis sp. NPDC004368]
MKRVAIRQLRNDEPVPTGTPKRYRNASGYVRLRWLVAPNQYVEAFEHRIAAGRPAAHLHVHHLNGVKDDNRPENLQVVTPEDHRRIHAGIERERRGGVGRWHPYRNERDYRRAQKRPEREAAKQAETARMRELYLSGMSTNEVGTELGIDGSNVFRRLKAAGVRMRSASEYADPVDAQSVVSQYEAGRGGAAIAREMHISYDRVKQILKAAGVKLRKTGRVPKSATWTEKDGKDALERRSSCCERCGNGGPLDWHHRKNRSQGGTWQPSNGLRLCRPCHIEITDTRPEFYERGWCVKEWQTPSEVPFEHWQLGPVLVNDETSDYHQKGAAA